MSVIPDRDLRLRPVAVTAGASIGQGHGQRARANELIDCPVEQKLQHIHPLCATGAVLKWPGLGASAAVTQGTGLRHFGQNATFRARVP